MMVLSEMLPTGGLLTSKLKAPFLPSIAAFLPDKMVELCSLSIARDTASYYDVTQFCSSLPWFIK